MLEDAIGVRAIACTLAGLLCSPTAPPVDQQRGCRVSESRAAAQRSLPRRIGSSSRALPLEEQIR